MLTSATTDTRTHSQSPSRPSFGEKISAFGSKLSRTLTGGESTVNEEEKDSIASLDISKDRSRSRGRDLLQSTGRGGFGNIRQSSESRDRPADGPDDFSATRGREPLANPTIMYSTGRGGAGNLRSPSRDASRGPDAREREVIKEYNQTHGDGPVSVGRGGLGNMSRSRSRDPAGGNRGVSTGRGGAGNIHAHEGGYNVNALDEAERKKHEVPAEGFHSTGRGGFANITESHEPDVERPAVHHNAAYHSSGRGGAGNIHTGA